MESDDSKPLSKGAPSKKKSSSQRGGGNVRPHATPMALYALVVALLLFYILLDKSSIMSTVVTTTRVTMKATPNSSSSITSTTVPEYDTAPTDYSWVGSRWVPPPGVPYYSPQDLRVLFQSENTLWWGDSTARQDYQTLYSMINADNLQDIPQQELDGHIHDGKFNNKTTANFINSTNNNSSSSSSSSNGKFDVTVNMGCVNKATWRFRKEYFKRLLSEYSVVILSVGVWDTMTIHCKTTNVSETPSYFVEELLEGVGLVAGPSLYIIWKTHGAGQGEKNQGNETLAMIQTARHWFSTHKPLHMGLSDFGSAMINSNRTFGENRIVGDNTAHWGTEARTLSIQMASHLIVQMKQKKI
jgi:hypothetical protein